MSTADEMTIGMLTGDEVITVDGGASLAEVARVLTDAGVGAVVVGTADKALSIVSERDIVRCVAEGTDLDATTAESVSSQTLVWADASAPVDEVAEQMMEEWVRHVLVEDGGKLVGVVSSRDLLGFSMRRGSQADHMTALFADRADAGQRLAARLDHLADSEPVVVGLPRGGVPVAAAVARALDAPLDVIMVRKLGVPSQPEVAMGAVGEGGVRVVDDETIRLAGVTPARVAEVEAFERDVLERRALRFAAGRSRIGVSGRVVIVVDDGIATGSTARAACQVARAQGAASVVLAVPVAPADWVQRLADVADEFVCVATPQPFLAVGRFYADFTQVDDAEVVRILRNAAMRTARLANTIRDGS